MTAHSPSTLVGQTAAGAVQPVAAQPAPGDLRLRAFVNAVFDAYYDWDVQTDHMEVSRQMETLLRLGPGQAVRSFTDFSERVHPRDIDRMLRNARRTVREGGVYEDEYRVRRGDGTYVYVRDRGVMLINDDGQPAHMIGAVRDVTAEREAGRAQREAADLYQTLFAQAVNPAFHIAEDGRFLDVNGAGIAFLQTTRTSLLRKTVASLWGEAAMKAVRVAVERGRVGTTLSLEVPIAGTIKALAVTLVPCSLRGRSTCFALGTDITEHRTLQHALEASEESLRRQAEALEDANTALRVILDQRNRDHAELERTIAANVQATVLPLLDRLRRRLGSTPETIYVDAIEEDLRELVHPFAPVLESLVGEGASLTVREREIATLIRAGKSSGEIAEALCISPATVAFHRRNLRRKLGLRARGPSLGAVLTQSAAPTRATIAGETEPDGASPEQRRRRGHS